MERKTDDAEWTVSNFSATFSTVLTWNQRPSYYTIIILIRISIEISMYLKIISISSLNKVGKRICLTQPPPLIHACLCLQLVPVPKPSRNLHNSPCPSKSTATAALPIYTANVYRGLQGLYGEIRVRGLHVHCK